MPAIRPEDHLTPLHNCTICPRNCRADRFSANLGYCQSGSEFAISSIFPHRGEEPVISGAHGICNIFFTHCNMQCLFCQNYQISRNNQSNCADQMGIEDIIPQIEAILDDGAGSVGFVSPSHYIPQMRAIMDVLNSRGRKPVYVFNTNGYDKKRTIESLENFIDVYLPDLKYMDESLAVEYSDAPGYPQIVTEALREMHRQKGSNIILKGDAVIQSGLIIRHLVLPGHVENSKQCLRFIAEELSPSVHISLMSQYYPTPNVAGHPKLDRYLLAEEYDEVLEEFERLGFYRGWIQEMDSSHSYRPDFTKPDVFW